MERHGLGALRSRLLAPLDGDVVEVGAGTGANLAHYGRPRSLTLVEPDPAMARRLRRRLDTVDLPGARVREGTLESALLPDACADSVVCTLVLCTAADPAALLAEVRRVLRPGGVLVLIEHVRHRGRAAALLQSLLTPVQRALAGGCRLDRATAVTVAEAGFDVSGLEPVGLFRPMAAGVAGVARPTAAAAAASARQHPAPPSRPAAR